MAKINFLTVEQVASIPEYQDKWRSVYLNTERIDRLKAESAVRQAYRVMGKIEPEIIFCPSPRSAIDRLQAYISQVEIPERTPMSPEQMQGQFLHLFVKTAWEVFKVNNKQQQAGTKPLTELYKEITVTPVKLLGEQIDRLLPKNMTFQDIAEQTLIGSEPLIDSMIKKTANLGEPETARTLQAAQDTGWQESLNMMQQATSIPGMGLISRGWLKNMLTGLITAKVADTEHPQFKEAFYASMSAVEQKFLMENPPIFTSDWAIGCTWLDFAFSVLNYRQDREKWSAVKELTLQCGWIFAMGKFCIVCDRPTKILTNADNWLHGVGETALEFADGWSTYANRGMIIPERYGAVNPSQWQSQWVLQEQNRSVQQILMREIGATRLCQDLPILEIDAVAEYTLAKLEGVDPASHCILKRSDPETGNLVAVFVAKDTNTVGAAIKYAHQNFAPEDFPIPNE
jgi:hypothetical protein